MLDLEAGRRTILRELDALLALLEGASADDWARDTRCEGWAVLDLASHCTLAPRAAAEAFRRMHVNVGTPGEAPVEPARERSEILETLHAGRVELTDALAALRPESLDRVFPLYFISLPGIYGLHLIALEVGMHRNDLEWALGREVSLPADVSEAGATLAPPLLMMLGSGADEQPPVGLAFVLASPSSRIELVYGEGQWRAGADPSVPTCVIEGDDSSIVLFVYGRVPASHPSLRVSGAVRAAGRFKAYFPGPRLEAPVAQR